MRPTPAELRYIPVPSQPRLSLDETDLAVYLIERLSCHVGCALCAFGVDLLQIILVLDQILGLFTDVTEQLDNRFTDSRLEFCIALASKCFLRLLYGLTGSQCVDLEHVGYARLILPIHADAGIRIGYRTLELTHDIFRLIHQQDETIRV